MNVTHLHLVLNHLPLAFGSISLLVAVLAVVSKNAAFKRLTLAMMVLTALTGAASYFTGLAAEQERFGPGSPAQEQVDNHRASANVSWIVGLVGGVVGAVGLVTTKRLNDVPAPVVGIAIATILVTMFFFFRTANLGGQIAHPEIRADSLSKALSPD